MGNSTSQADPLREATFTPTFGFPDRQERKSFVTAEQMQEAVIPLACRDYCAHEYIRLLRCRRENFPNYWACNEEKHAWQKCGFDDEVLRMKEFEREKRLRMRQQRIEVTRSAA
uniref:NADH dehydrogenase [ubiquinone] 1 beta subcomplex subunit 7 n=1 Tax=Myxine glutinosa TaxID=7769 RepID=UPI00358F9848